MPRDALPAERMAFSHTITKRLASMRLQTARTELNAGLRKKEEEPQRPAHPFLAYLEQEELKRRAQQQTGQTAGPMPRSWRAPAPASVASAYTEEGKRERKRLRLSSFGDDVDGMDQSGLRTACLQQIALAAASRDEETLDMLCYLPTHLQQRLMHVAALEAPLSWATLEALFLTVAEEPVEEIVPKGEEWEARLATDELEEPLTRLDLRFSSLSTSNLLLLLFREREVPRFPALAMLDLSFCSKLVLNNTFFQQLAHLPHLLQLALVGHEHALLAVPGSLTRLAAATPRLQTFELGGSVPLSLFSVSWGILWQKVDLLILRGFRLPQATESKPPGADQPRAGSLSSNAKDKRLEDEEAATRAEQALRDCIKKGGRSKRWIDIVV